MNECNQKIGYNWDEYTLTKPQFFLDSAVQGKVYHQVNDYSGKIFCYPVEKGKIIREGDTVLINRYCEAIPYQIVDELGEVIPYQLIGKCLSVLYADSEKTQQVVLLKDIAIFQFYNSKINPITKEDIASSCYIENFNTVTKEPTNIFAGQIAGIEGNIVIVVVELKGRSK